MSDRRNIYLSEEEQRNLVIIAHILAHDGVDGTVRDDQDINRTVTIRKLIEKFKAGVSCRSDLRWDDIEANLVHSGVLKPLETKNGP